MALYSLGDMSVYHIHIPKTGGRFISKILTSNNFAQYHDDCDESIYGISFQHLHYPLYEWLEGVPTANHFAIVRNPFSRFSSVCNNILNEWHIDNKNEVIKNLESKEGLFNFIDFYSYTKRYNSNWLRPQNQFISEKTSVYKFEQGLSKSFIKWFEREYNFKLELKQDEFYYGSSKELLNNEIIGNKKIEAHVKEYYRDDYEIFEY